MSFNQSSALIQNIAHLLKFGEKAQLKNIEHHQQPSQNRPLKRNWLMVIVNALPRIVMFERAFTEVKNRALLWLIVGGYLLVKKNRNKVEIMMEESRFITEAIDRILRVGTYRYSSCKSTYLCNLIWRTTWWFQTPRAPEVRRILMILIYR